MFVGYEDVERHEALGAAIRRYGGAHGDSYAGMYWLEDQPDVALVGFVDDGEEHLRALRRLTGARDELGLFVPAHTYQELSDLQDALDNATARLEAAGIPIASTGLNVQHNLVEVGTPDPTRAKADALASLFPGAPVKLIRDWVVAAAR